jgi:hypothetical protein
MLLIVLYVAYLVQVGLLMIMLPWSEVWSVLILRLSPAISFWLDSPAVKGLLTGFGVLHLLMLAIELKPISRGTPRTAAD